MKIYNTMSKQLEEFTPIEAGKVKIYTCGPTVYNLIHIGNARMLVVFDVLRRYLTYSGYEVEFVQNVTDVDDRIIEQAKRERVSEKQIAERYTEEFNKDLKHLNVWFPTVQPKVTDHITEIVYFIQDLIDKGMAYERDGNVWYRTSNYPQYGKLTNQKITNNESTENEHEKENPVDFALWKKQKGNEIFWYSPFGKGRPGWHIECSAMSMKYLGETMDIHGGGLDLCFPHHENEIAQTEALTGKKMANYWVHNNYVTVDGQKMSKSIGNFTTLRDALEAYSANAIRWFFLSVNYGNEIDYSEMALHQATVNVEKINTLIEKLESVNATKKTSKHTREIKQEIKTSRERFKEAMDYNMDTSSALDEILRFTKKINEKARENHLIRSEAKMVLTYLEELFEVLGLEKQEKDLPEKLKLEIEQLITKRDTIKLQAQNALTKEEKVALFEKSDRLRDELLRKGVQLEDTKHGTTYKIV